MPCSDNDTCKNECDDQCIAATTNNSQHNEDIEHCSPFCICTCCGCQGFNVESFPAVAISLNQAAENKIPHYGFQFVSQFSANIWQPPKLS